MRIFFGALLILGIAISPTGRRDEMGYALHDIGSAIYSYHQQTGRWPTNNPTLLEPEHSLINRGQIVVVPNVFLHSDPKHNSHTILAYQAKGFRTWLGFTYVCWGDLRTEIITRWQLQKALNTNGWPN
jgi:hypothetical protein